MQVMIIRLEPYLGKTKSRQWRKQFAECFSVYVTHNLRKAEF